MLAQDRLVDASQNILDRIIRYEAVHEDPRLERSAPPHRSDRPPLRLLHPQLTDEPLIFVEVALTKTDPTAIGRCSPPNASRWRSTRARTAVFSSISNTQKGLGGISFGSFLIKQVVEELRRELPKLRHLRHAVAGAGLHAMAEAGRTMFRSVDEDGRCWNISISRLVRGCGADRAPARRAGAAGRALLPKARTSKGRLIDSVARFHIGNGARLERIDWLGDLSPKGLRESAGIMVNYLYRLEDIEKNHEAYANQGEHRCFQRGEETAQDRRTAAAGYAAVVEQLRN